MKWFVLAVFAFQLGWGQGIISTVAGGGTNVPGDGGPATSALLPQPNGVAVDPAGNLYIVDASPTVRKVAPGGVITTFAGDGISVYSGDGGPATSAGFVTPWGLAADHAGNVYVVDQHGDRVRKIDTSGTITTVAGNGLAGPLNLPARAAVDAAGNLYIADEFNLKVRKVDTSGNITVIAGNGNSIYPDGSNLGDGGPATSAAVGTVNAVAVDSSGNVFLSEGTYLRMVNPAGVISTLAGNGTVGYSGDGGPASKAAIGVNDLATDHSGNVYFADNNHFRVREVNMSSGLITTVAGNGTYKTSGDGGLSTSAGIHSPYGVAVDSANNLYIACDDGLIRKVALAASTVPAISSNGVQNGASFAPGITPGSWATIKGTGLSTATGTWTVVNGVLPTALDGVKVSVGGQAGFVYYVSPGQINFVVPNVAAGSTQVSVTNAAGTSAAATVTAAVDGPAFFPWPGGQAVATRQDFSFAVKNGTFAGTTTVPAKPGDVIILWGTGFGATTPTAPVGMQVPAGQTYSTTSLPSVTINNVAATVYGAALAPGFAGLYQVAVQVPASLGNGDWPVVATIGGVSSPGGVVLTVQQ